MSDVLLRKDWKIYEKKERQLSSGSEPSCFLQHFTGFFTTRASKHSLVRHYAVRLTPLILSLAASHWQMKGTQRIAGVFYFGTWFCTSFWIAICLYCRQSKQYAWHFKRKNREVYSGLKFSAELIPFYGAVFPGSSVFCCYSICWH